MLVIFICRQIVIELPTYLMLGLPGTIPGEPPTGVIYVGPAGGGGSCGLEGSGIFQAATMAPSAGNEG